MNTETFGMSGSQGLLAQMQSEENRDLPVHQSSTEESPAKVLEQGRSEERPFEQLERTREGDEISSKTLSQHSLKIVAENDVNDPSTSDAKRIVPSKNLGRNFRGRWAMLKRFVSNFRVLFPSAKLKIKGGLDDVKDFGSIPPAEFPTQLVLLKDLPPVIAAFSVEQIQKKIFSLMDPSDLLQCRLVSKSWLQMATNEKLLVSNKAAIWIRYVQGQRHPTFVRVKQNWKRELKDVTDFLDGLGSHPLLYSVEVELILTTPQNDFEFIDRYGFVVTSLIVIFQGKENGEDVVHDMESSLELLTELLTEQLPNLKRIFVEFERNDKFDDGIDPQQLLTVKKGLHFANKQNHSLRTIDVGNRTPYEIINALCCLAPNLEKLEVDDLRFWAENPHRLHLLKELILEERSWGRFTDEQFFPALATIEAKPSLTKFTIGFEYDRYEPELWSEIATLVTKILENSSHSLEELVLAPQYFLPGTVFPRMPNVKMLTLRTSWSENPEFKVLPLGTSIATTFPNLYTLKIREYCAQDTRPTPKEAAVFVKHILSQCKNEKVASVKKIITEYFRVDRKLFKKQFPNAVVAK